jgi:hypothetical protein
MKRRDLFVKGAMALVGVTLMPLGKLFGEPHQELVSKLAAREFGPHGFSEAFIEAYRLDEEMRSRFKQDRVFIFHNRGGKMIFPVHNISTGKPTSSNVLYVCYWPAGSDGEDNLGPLPAPWMLKSHEHGSRTYCVQFERDATAESIRRDVNTAIKLVTA